MTIPDRIALVEPACFGSERGDHHPVLAPCLALPMRQAGIQISPKTILALHRGGGEQVMQVGETFACHQAMNTRLAVMHPMDKWPCHGRRSDHLGASAKFTRTVTFPAFVPAITRA
ncbi:hypothetical protein AV944_18055 (plasmid) [Sphingomonas sp. LK11]|nr:hypothetical protein AV944_18055 [Sphingomonas sp. LK11]